MLAGDAQQAGGGQLPEKWHCGPCIAGRVSQENARRTAKFFAGVARVVGVHQGRTALAASEGTKGKRARTAAGSGSGGGGEAGDEAAGAQPDSARPDSTALTSRSRTGGTRR